MTNSSADFSASTKTPTASTAQTTSELNITVFFATLSERMDELAAISGEKNKEAEVSEKINRIISEVKKLDKKTLNSYHVRSPKGSSKDLISIGALVVEKYHNTIGESKKMIQNLYKLLDALINLNDFDINQQEPESKSGLLHELVRTRVSNPRHDMIHIKNCVTLFRTKKINLNLSDKNQNTIGHLLIPLYYSNEEQLVGLLDLLIQEGYGINRSNNKKQTLFDMTAPRKEFANKTLAGYLTRQGGVSAYLWEKDHVTLHKNLNKLHEKRQQIIERKNYQDRQVIRQVLENLQQLAGFTSKLSVSSESTISSEFSNASLAASHCEWKELTELCLKEGIYFNEPNRNGITTINIILKQSQEELIKLHTKEEYRPVWTTFCSQASYEEIEKFFSLITPTVEEKSTQTVQSTLTQATQASLTVFEKPKIESDADKWINNLVSVYCKNEKAISSLQPTFNIQMRALNATPENFESAWKKLQDDAKALNKCQGLCEGWLKKLTQADKEKKKDLVSAVEKAITGLKITPTLSP